MIKNLLVIAMIAGLAGPAAAEEGPSAQDLKQANNPLANMKAVNFQNYYMPSLYGVPDATANTAWLRYIQPFGRWLMRASLPISTRPTGGGEYASGLGDLNAFMAYLFTPPDAGAQFGVGPLVVAPTASDDALGVDAWELGAAAVYFNAKSPKLQYGGLVTYQTDVSGDDDTSTLVLQPFAIWQLGRGTYLRSSPLWVFDLENDRRAMPIGLGIGKVIKQGNTVFNLFVEPQFTILNEGIGNPSFQVFIGVNLQFMSSGKKKAG